MLQENLLLKNKHTLITIGDFTNLGPIYEELVYIQNNFCGIVVKDIASLNVRPDTIVYICGDIGTILPFIPSSNQVYIIKELSYNYGDNIFITIDQVPINVHNAGVYFRKLFKDENYFDNISTEHAFQNLTQSNKPGEAFRKGIYLTNVEKKDAIRFNLLRCSTNLSGPPDNFRSTDFNIINTVNDIANNFFAEPVNMNHVLAQIYENKTIISNAKQVERKARISAHSDKTKDMPRNGLIAFCTFYKDFVKSTYRNTSVLTKLCFKLKPMVKDPTLIKEFSIALYPNSLFLIPLSTNRLYTHEIQPSVLPIDKIPTRLGYVIRCSNTKAVYKDGNVYIDNDNEHIKLEKITPEDRKSVTDLYYKENATDEIIEYKNLYFSMNDGDYMEPIV